MQVKGPTGLPEPLILKTDMLTFYFVQEMGRHQDTQKFSKPFFEERNNITVHLNFFDVIILNVQAFQRVKWTLTIDFEEDLGSLV
ncbi:hypothetical protein C0J52_13405 [Blattella germanica]|nr:hypothetical protein C0J52_13405 [Blattella germanica]